MNKELSKTIEKIIKKTTTVLDNSSDEDDDDTMKDIFCDIDNISEGNQRGDVDVIKNYKDNIRKIRGRIEKLKMIKLERIELDKNSWCDNWQADLLRKSTALQRSF